MTLHASPKVYRLGEKALVLDCSELFPAQTKLTIQSRIWQLAQTCTEKEVFIDIVPGMNNLTIYLKESAQSSDWLARLVPLWNETKATAIFGPTIEIPVQYGGQYGPDLDEVARRHQLDTEEVVRRHSTPEYTVLFLGFQPGFPYLDGLDSSLFTPRLSTPRLSIPAGSVGIGGSQTGIYPATSPGGWQLIGRTNIALFTPQLPATPTLLVPGYKVRFTPVSSLEFISL
ncbi:5-oxoprolinase subunit PxpB [Shewanella sp. D64]|uniref:5-oxoprolinase subunit PxpB n=1 Tax=unclassified Shewanella TaxID=196818 RepID=UPI0022BA2379|nr:MULTISPECIES: 5-oxoprolinase subunit PxpB [unclassified Shewanella]MEC4727156.1 5-oxoprolinase subunit PxpB [Shewanella sp. D64]MEC4739227.1 5-oxoprolinase subunit PxpB [Shewanella sp. E94]WBJ95567.1 5-oxoprolinase subunit PxpB [Shewanella sp. MTB7]